MTKEVEAFNTYGWGGINNAGSYTVDPNGGGSGSTTVQVPNLSPASANSIPPTPSPQVETKHQYAIGDLVRVDFDKNDYRVKELTGINVWSIPEYMLENVAGGNIIYQMETDIKKIKEDHVNIETGCQCGARFTSFSEHHMQYCRLYKGDKK